ncbi:hypothetical protein AJ79_08080 [Helicocarpus griseus UAMH5409]|uniref:DUF3074 domain-containing protein n=1 Tax=Helicocarpus griseus UAMH5409 TaxID=1447875 RepID=A0A2B7WW53_9EURO|nr:hypothetical protein AJ79_08080 [Helicocarpus griseus UAMH5409]
MSRTAIPSLLHPVPLPPSSIPAHPSIPFPFPSSTNADSRPTLTQFLHSALTEANTFITGTVTKKPFSKDSKPHPSPPSLAQVELSTGSLKATPIHSASAAANNKEDKWFVRRTVHENRAVKGTAEFSEFVRGLKEDHSVNEMAYTPSISDVKRIAEWDCKEVKLEGGWGEVEASVNLITHTFHPTPLIAPRAFLVLLITAFLPSPSRSTKLTGFLTVQLPLHSSALQNPSLPKNTILANYVSVEHVRLLPESGTSESSASEPGQIEWTMATSSDAGGWIPEAVQQSWVLGGVPKAVVKDVGLFLGWVDERRREKGNKTDTGQ